MQTQTLDQPTVALDGFSDVSEWLTQLQDKHQALYIIGWEFLQTLRDGIDQFGRANDHALAELYDLASQTTNMSTKRLQNLVSMSRNAVAEIAQEYELEFGYAEAVLGLEPDEADDILSRAKAHAMSVSQVRKEAWNKKQAAPDGGNSSTPHADAIDRDWLQDDEDPPYCNDANYTDPLPAGYDFDDAFIAVPRDPVAAASVLRAQFSAGDLATLVQALIR